VGVADGGVVPVHDHLDLQLFLIWRCRWNVRSLSRKAVAGGETDIVLTKDLVPVLHHDIHLPDGQFIKDLNVSELPHQIPTLSPAIREVEDIEWLLEIKRPLSPAGRVHSSALIVKQVVGQLIDIDWSMVQV
jgi:glycerophosphoryl diester phosphodiesterase